MQKDNDHMPVYGVGPYYGAGIIILTVTGIVLYTTGILDSGKVTNSVLITIMVILGTALIVEGFLIWKFAATGRNCIDDYIKTNQLCCTGVYSIVRNPCYSGVMFMCSGVVIIFHDLWLLLLPVIAWAAMTILMKKTEEKWLTEVHGQEYIDYCRNVNRCIPWFPSKK